MDQPHTKSEPALECAVEFLEVLPLMMGALQCELRRDPATKLTMVQFRTLAFLSKHETASVSQIAEFLGLGLPATSKIVDGLVNSKAITRKGDPVDRRKVLLELTASGRNELLAARAISHNHLANMLSPLSEPERAQLLETVHFLRRLFLNPNHEVC